MDFVIIPLVAMLASLLTFFSGFGLGTLLMPVFAIFYPVEVAVALTGVVHLLNNLFKIALVYKNIDLGVALRFGLPAILMALVGAVVLTQTVSSEPFHAYEVGTRLCEMT
ncbi:MAG: putative membrane protein YfcA, partial [Bacteroidia bacterium]